MKEMVVFLGDSLTAGNAWGRAFPRTALNNMGVNGDTWAGVWCRLEAALALIPTMIFLQIGINDFLRGAPPEEIVAGHLKIWDELSSKRPEAKLRVVSLLPYMEELLPGLPPNLDLMDLNRTLAEKARQRDIPFIDLFSALADPDNQLPAQYTTDGVHLSQAAYRIWEDSLRPFLEPRSDV